jgi:hypothetical protein
MDNIRFWPRSGRPGLKFQVISNKPFIANWRGDETAYSISFEGVRVRAVHIEITPPNRTKIYILECFVPISDCGRVTVKVNVQGVFLGLFEYTSEGSLYRVLLIVRRESDAGYWPPLAH